MYDPIARATDPDYLAYQYGDSEKVRIRADTHRDFSERPNDWQEWVIALLRLRSGDRLLDAGCGPGLYHPSLSPAGVRTVALDYQLGMVVEAREQARRENLAVEVLQADAQALPFPDASFDRVMANHMLYHVPDQLAALREIHRVTRTGGRVVLATVAGDQNQRLIDLHAEVAASLGLDSTEGSGARFTLDHLDLVRQVFPSGWVELRDDAFIFRSAEPALRYYASGMINAIDRRHGDASVLSPRLLAGMRERIESIIAREGVFRVPKNAGAFVAERD